MFIPIAGYLYSRQRVSSAPMSHNVNNNSSYGSGSMLIFLIFSLWAAYLSWSCNATKLTGFGMKILYSLGAFIQGVFYLLNYYVFKMNTKTCCGN